MSLTLPALRTPRVLAHLFYQSPPTTHPGLAQTEPRRPRFCPQIACASAYSCAAAERMRYFSANIGRIASLCAGASSLLRGCTPDPSHRMCICRHTHMRRISIPPNGLAYVVLPWFAAGVSPQNHTPRFSAPAYVGSLFSLLPSPSFLISSSAHHAIACHLLHGVSSISRGT